MATVWRLMAHWEEPEEVAQWMKKEGRISIGWCQETDLSKHRTPEEIGKAILQAWPESHTHGSLIFCGGKTDCFTRQIYTSGKESSSSRIRCCKRFKAVT